MTATVGPRWFTLSQASRVLGPGAPSQWTLRKEVDAGRLHAKRVGRILRVLDDELERWSREENNNS